MMRDRLLRTATLLLALSFLTPVARAGEAARPAAATGPASFATLAASIRPDAEAAGVRADTLERAFAGLTPDPSVAAMTRRQPEFVKPLGAYLTAQVTRGRVAQGRSLLERWRRDLDAIAERTGVPASVVVAVWGLESNYGASTGRKDVIRSLATLAAMDYRPQLYRAELVSALMLLQSGAVPRGALTGSWAGAMGQPQFMPSSFARYAVDQDRDGHADIWTSVPDTLASIARFLQAQGWVAGEPWGMEVRLPVGFDVGIGRGRFSDWAARGLVRADGRPLPQTGEAALFFPAGAQGPAFLVTANYEVLKTYNFSDAYVLSVAQLADRMEGGAPIEAPWPQQVGMGREARIALQARLSALGYPVDNREGRISLAFRDVIREAQRRVGQVPDGNPTEALLAALPPAP